MLVCVPFVFRANETASDRKTGVVSERSSSTRAIFEDKAALYESLQKVKELEKVIANQRSSVQGILSNPMHDSVW